MTQFRFDEILRLLNAHGVEYVVIGGIAGTLWGSDQITFDLDICYSRDRENIQRLVAALTALDARLRNWPESVTHTIDERTFRLGDTMTFDTRFGPFDCLGTPSGTTGYADLMEHAGKLDLDDGSVMVASIDDIIRMKRSAARPKDLLAVEHLKLLKKLLSERD